MELARRGEVTPPRQVKRSIPRPLERVCLRRLAADPAKRFGSAEELRRALRLYRQRPLWIAGAGVAAACVLGIIPVMKRPAPPAGSDSAVSSNTSQGPVAHPPLPWPSPCGSSASTSSTSPARRARVRGRQAGRAVVRGPAGRRCHDRGRALRAGLLLPDRLPARRGR